MNVEKLSSGIEMYSSPVISSDLYEDKKIMALTVDKELLKLGIWQGLARVITKREGNVDVPGYVDKSKLWKVESNDGLSFKLVEKLEIEGIDEIVEKLRKDGCELIGLEDPDIWTDELGVKHVYFTIAFRMKCLDKCETYLGHAFGDELSTLKATMPCLSPMGEAYLGFKEACISPIVSHGKRFALVEMGIDEKNKYYSAVGLASIRGDKWKFEEVVLHPLDVGYDWCAGHLSPCTIFPSEFITHQNLLVGIINGRQTEEMIDGKLHYRKFRPGLFLFDSNTGKIPWVSKEQILEDPEATTITFASDFVQITKNEGILYCHVNDSFVRAYRITPKMIKSFLPGKL